MLGLEPPIPPIEPDWQNRVQTASERALSGNQPVMTDETWQTILNLCEANFLNL